jgi:small-conductance mechanosensitive channel
MNALGKFNVGKFAVSTFAAGRFGKFAARTALIGLTVFLTACAVSREDRLRDKADRLNDKLVDEREKILDNPQFVESRDAQLTHLTTLRTTLSAINIGLGSTRYLAEQDRDLAYDVIEEAYDTIEWNIPYASPSMQKTMPMQFQNGVLNFK